MQRLNLTQNTDEWFAFRKGKIGGSKVKDIIVKRGNGKKLGFYQLIADKLGLGDGESSREHGQELEGEARQHLAKLLGREVKPGAIWISDLDKSIYISPDCEISDTEAAEIKCLSSARHIQNIVEDRVPSDHYDQVVQYFLVNDKLEALYYTSYDPRITAQPIHIVTVTREQVEADVSKYKEYLLDTLKEANDIVEKLAF